MGNTRVICGVMIEETIPRWMKEQGVTGGWLTAEYSMLPYATLDRKDRDISKGKLDGRSQEIQRLIGRSLRAVVDLAKATIAEQSTNSVQVYLPPDITLVEVSPPTVRVEVAKP